MALRALIFDVDGTLAETEEVHRAAFNRVFGEEGLSWVWDVGLYSELLRVTGGKERLRAYADRIGITLADDRIARMHVRKNTLYGEMIRSGATQLRPGVETLIRSAASAGLALAICTTTSRTNIEALIAATLGAGGLSRFASVVAGEDVVRKKPAPDAYLAVLEELRLPAGACLAFEDSRNGLAASLAAGVPTIVTPGIYTAHENFEGAQAVLPDLEGFDWRTPVATLS